MPMLSQNAAVIEGRRAAQLTIGAAAAATPVLEEGVYDLWSDVDVFVRVADVRNTSPNRAIDVTVTNGYFIKGATPSTAIQVTAGRLIGAIAGGAGTLNYHKRN